MDDLDSDIAAMGAASKPPAAAPAPQAPMEHPIDTSTPVLEPGGATAPVGAGPPPPPKPMDPLEADIAAMGKVAEEPDTSAQHAAAFRAVNGPAPEKQLEANQYAQGSGLSPGLTAEHIDDVKKGVDKQHMAAVLLNSPGLANFVANPAKAAVVKDDVGVLGKVESMLSDNFHWLFGSAPEFRDGKLIQKPGAWEQNLEHAIGQQVYVYRSFMAANGDIPSDDPKLLELKAQFGDKDPDYGAHNWFTTGIAKLPEMGVFIAGQAGATAAGTSIGAGVAASSSVETGPGEAIAIPAGGATGGMLGNAAFNYYQNRGPLFMSLAQMRTPDGKRRLTDDEARNYASMGSAIVGGLMANFAGKLPMVNKLVSRLGGTAIQSVLEKGGFAEAMRRFVFSFGKAEAAGVALGTAQALTNHITVGMAEAQHGGDAKWQDILASVPQIALDSAKSFAIISAIEPGHAFMGEMGRASLSAESINKLQSLVDASKESKTLDRSPADFESAVKSSQGQNAQNVYVDRDSWVTYWQGQKVDPGQMAAHVMGDQGKAFAEAQQTRGDLAIPVEKYLKAFAKTPHAEGLADDMRLSQEGVSPRQARASFEAEAKKVAADGEAKSPAEQLNELIYSKAIAAGRSHRDAQANADIQAAAFSRFAADPAAQGKNALELYTEDFPLKMYGPKGETMAEQKPAPTLEEGLAFISRMRLDNRDTATAFMEYTQGKREQRPDISPELEKKLARAGIVDPKGFYGLSQGPNGPGAPEASRLLHERFSTLGHPDVADDIYRDHATGALNETAFKEMPAPEGALHARFETGNIKNLNDHPEFGGHEIADGPLRAIARELSAAHDGDIYQVRGGFRAYVKDHAQMERLRDTVNAALGDSDFPVIGSTGATEEEAYKAMDVAKDEARAKGEFPARDKLSPEFEKRLPTLKFSDERAAKPLPEALVKKVGDMPAKEAFEKGYVEKDTGLLTAKGWNLIPRKKFVAAIDLRGLKLVNDQFGTGKGDEMLRHFGEQSTKAGGSDFDFAHRSGDEYLAQSNDRESLVQHLDALRSTLEKSKIPAVDPRTGEGLDVVVRFRHGLGEGEHAETLGDRELNRQRVEGSAAANNGPRGVREGGPADGGLVRTDVPERPQGDSAAGEGQQAPGEIGHGQGQADSGDDARGVRRDDSVDRREVGVDREDSDSRAPVRGPRADGVPQRFPGTAEEVASSLKQGGHPIAEAEGQTFKLEKKGDRGYISFGPEEAGEPRRFDLKFLKDADESTFAHETAHFLGEVMGSLAQRPEASPELKADYQGLLDFMGHASHEERQANARERNALSNQETRTPEESARLKELTAKEERLSHAWEQYLGEGKAPSAALAGTFMRFKNWMAKIYRGLQGINSQFRDAFGEDIGMSDKVRGIFDRILASQDEIAKTQAANESAKPFEAALSSMTPEEKAAYGRTQSLVQEQAEQELTRRVAQAQRKENTEWMRTERARLTDDVQKELDTDPAQRALKYLQTGELPDGQSNEMLKGEDGQPMKLSRADVVDMFGTGFAATMPRGIFAPRGQGAHPEVIAALLGFEGSGEDFVRTLQRTPTRELVVGQEVQKRLTDLYGPSLLDNPQELAAQALDAVHNDAAAAKTLLEIKALRKQLQPNADPRTQALSLETAQATAERLVQDKSVGDLTGGEQGLAGRYLRAERTAAKRALDAATSGNLHEALAQKEVQLLNFSLYREASKVRGEMETLTKKLQGSGKDSWRKSLGLADPAYRQAHDAILQAIGIQPKEPGQPPPSLDALEEKAKADAQEMAFDFEGLKELVANPGPLKGLNVIEARSVLDAVTNIRRAAQIQTEVVLNGKALARDAFFKELRETTSASRDALPATPYSKTAAGQGLGGLKRKVASWGRGADALLSDMETVAAMMDGDAKDGPMKRLLVDDRLKARDHETELVKKVLEPIRKTWESIPKDIKKLRDQTVDVGDLLPVPAASINKSPVYTRDNLWMLFLNSGNEGNKQRLRDGNGWSDANMQKALSLLKPEETKFLQSVLDSIESVYPELAKAHERRTGLPLGKVEATPIRVNGEEHRGGYFPLKYDSDASRQGELQDDNVLAALLPAQATPPAAASGHRKARVETVNAPVDLSWGVVPAHLAQVTHDIAYGDWVRQAGRVMLDPEFKEITKTYMGDEYAKQFIPWLRDVANAKADSAAAASSGAIKTFGSFARSRIATAAIGLNLPSLLAHVTDPLNTVAVGVKYRFIAQGYLKMMNPLSRAGMEGIPLSKELAYREANFTDNLKQQLGQMGKVDGWRQIVNGVAFKLHEINDHFLTRAAFTAAYDQGLSEGMQQDEAVKFGDEAVRRVFPSHDVAEKSPILRTKSGAAAALMFYGYANRIFNLGRRGFNDGAIKGAATMLQLSAVGAGAAFLAGRGPDKDEDKAGWAGRKLLLEPFNTLPFIAPFIEGVVTGKPVNVRATPELAVLQQSFGRLSQMLHSEKEGTATTEDRIWNTVETMLGVGVGVAGQAHRTIPYLHSLANGTAEPRGPGDVVSGLIYGKRDKQGLNPASALQNAASGE